MFEWMGARGLLDGWENIFSLVSTGQVLIQLGKVGNDELVDVLRREIKGGGGGGDLVLLFYSQILFMTGNE